ncbi:hypothetical protein ACQP2F_15460 [Actinoplanes sp. CA-030573]|uniref:hypothetical protein n=1 Tax=Actinoplanes sp. CA-030573 TaxID=3239898 RepID=UPI003D940EF3
MTARVIRLTVDRLPSRDEPEPFWRWWSKVDATAGDFDGGWQTFERRFDIARRFRQYIPTLG